MKKLLAIVASALTLGAFADASKMPATFELPEGLEADTVQLVHDGEPILDITVSGSTVNLDTNDLAAGDYWLALADGTQLTEVFTIEGAEEFIYSRTLAGLKLAGEGDNELIIAEGTLESPTSVDLVGKKVTINKGCAAKFTAGTGNKVITVTGSGANSYLILDGACGYGFADGSKISNVTVIIQDSTNAIWLEDRANPVFDESVKLIVKSTGKATFSAGQQANPYVAIGSIITEKGATLVGREGVTVYVADAIDIGGATTVPDYMAKGVIWNNAINGWTDTTTSAGGTTITKDHTVVFDGFEKVLYNTCTAESKIRVVGGTLKIGHNADDDNLKSGSVVTIGSNCQVELRCYDNVTSNTRSVNLPETIAFNGPGSVYVEEHINTVKIGSITGNAQIDLGSSVANVTVSGTIANAISGAATVNAYTGMSFANTWAGTVKAGAIDNNGQKLNLNTYGVAGSKVEIKSLVNYWIENNAAARTVNPEIVLKGHMLQNNMSQQAYVFKAISGTADALLEFGLKSGTYNPNSMTIETLKDFAGTIKNTMGKSVVISTLKTSLETIPESKTKVVNIAEGSTGGFTVTAATLADGTAIDSDKISVEEDGIYVLGNAPAAPGIELVDEADKQAYTEWAATNVPTGEYTDAQKKNFAIAFHLGATVSEGVTIEEAAQSKVEELVKKIDLAALAGEGGVEAALDSLNAELQDKGLVAELDSVDLEGVDVDTTKLYRLVIKLIAEN